MWRYNTGTCIEMKHGWDEGEGGWGEKSQIKMYKEGTCTKMSHEQDFKTNTNLQAKWSNSSQVKVTSSQRCLDTFVIVTAHKQVCANQQSLHVSLKGSFINHKQASSALFFSLTRTWVGFLARGLRPKCWSILTVTDSFQESRIDNLVFNQMVKTRCRWVPLWQLGMEFKWPVVGPYPSQWTEGDIVAWTQVSGPTGPS